nr:hypothetical protein [Marseillevirus cajuinensis]
MRRSTKIFYSPLKSPQKKGLKTCAKLRDRMSKNEGMFFPFLEDSKKDIGKDVVLKYRHFNTFSPENGKLQLSVLDYSLQDKGPKVLECEKNIKIQTEPLDSAN